MTNNVWDADIAIDAALAARLIARQFPSLFPVSTTPFGAGWDNAAFLVPDHDAGELVFRFPRRRIAVPLLTTEARCLPLLAPRLPVPIPSPLYRGEPEADFPHPFLGYRLLPGVTADRVTWTDDRRAALAAPLAEFLRMLHAIPIEGAIEAAVPGDTLGRADTGARLASLRERMERLRDSDIEFNLDFDRLLALADCLARTRQLAEPPCLLHGDLYARHLLIDENHRLCGVIDWGDLHRGDRAIDLSVAFTFLPPRARSAFRAAYGAIDDATWDRARFRAIHYGAILTLYGADTGDATIEAAGRYALTTAGLNDDRTAS